MTGQVMKHNRKFFEFTETKLTRLICEASGRYFRSRYTSPQELRHDFQRRGLRTPAWDTAAKWLSGEDAPSMKRSGSIMAAGFTDYLHTIGEAVCLATDEHRREQQRAETLARHQRELEEIDAIETIDLASRRRNGIARGDDIRSAGEGSKAVSPIQHTDCHVDKQPAPSSESMGE